MMRPWEQHCNVIIIPRFDYNAPSSLLQHSHTGFLITCPIKREKSATKEAMSILEKYFMSSNTATAAGSFEVCSSTQEMVGEFTATSEMSCIHSEDAADELSNSNPSHQEVSQENGNTVHLSLVKLTRSGLLLFIFPNDRSMDTTGIVSSIMESLGNGSLTTPRWCHRIFPIQATCNLNEKELHAVVLKLVHEFVEDEKKKLPRPVKYAVGFNRRGIWDNELKPSKYSADTSVGALLDRNKCFEIVGSAVKDVIPDSVVDLNNPEMSGSFTMIVRLHFDLHPSFIELTKYPADDKLSILVELLPLSGVTNGPPVVAVSVLPSFFVVSKPKLCIRALLSATKMSDTASYK